MSDRKSSTPGGVGLDGLERSASGLRAGEREASRIGRARPLAPFGALFLASGLALVTYILSGVSLAWTFAGALTLAAAGGAVLWRRAAPARRAVVARAVRVGIPAGIVATLAYDGARRRRRSWRQNRPHARSACAGRRAATRSPSAITCSTMATKREQAAA